MNLSLSDDVLYCIILAFSLPFGWFVKSIKSPDVKSLVCSVTGVAIVYVTCGLHILHSFVTILFTCAIIKFTGPRKCHFYTYIWCFGYLAFFRTCHYFGFPQVPPLSNAVQLLLTLRLTGLAYEIHDTSKISSQEDLSQEDKELIEKYRRVDPSIPDIFHYGYCYIGQFTGPYYKYRTYYDMIHQDKPEEIECNTPLFNRLRDLPVIGVTYFFFIYFFSIEYVQKDEFFEEPFWFRLFYMVPMFIIFRMRMYTAWILSECMCMTAALGAYPEASTPKCGQGPSNLKSLDDCKNSKEKKNYNFETIHNLSIYGCELGRTTREGLRSWNMTVQYWLAANCHHRIPRSLKAYRVVITMTISAFWHGVYPGYYLSFLLVPVILLAEDAMIAAFRHGTDKQKEYFDWACLFFKMRGFDYMCMGFLLLRLDYTLSYWKSIFFIGHIVPIIFILVGKAFKKNIPREEKKAKSS